MLPSLGSVTAFEYECYKASKYAANTVESEELEEMQANSGNGKSNAEKFGATVDPNPQAHDPFKW